MKPSAPSIRKMATTLLWSVAGIIGFLAFFFLTLITVRSHITERYSFAAKEHDAEVRLAVMVPKTGPYQTVNNFKMFGDGVYVTEPDAQAEVIQFTGRALKGQTNEAVISYDVRLQQGRARWSGPVTQVQRLPQPGIESDPPLIVGQARKLVSGQTREDAYPLFKFAASYLSWPRGSRTHEAAAAAHAYQTRIGGCHEFANLMVALCRVAGIPAQTISGLYLFPTTWSRTQVWGHPGGAHAWVEFNTSVGWEMADPSFASSVPWKCVAFGRNDGGHLSYGENDEYDRVYQEMLAWAEGSGKIIGAMSSPIRFAAAAQGEGVQVVPTIRLQKSLWDVRWLGLVGFIVLALLVKWRRRRTLEVHSQP